MNAKLIEPVSRRFMHLGRAYLNLLAKRMEHLGLSRHYYALAFICYHDGELTQKALAEELAKDKSLVVTIIDTLSEQGFVYREINPADRREHILKVTDKAKRAVPEILEVFALLNDKITEDISGDELETFNAVLNKMSDNLRSFNGHQLQTK